MKLEMKEIDGVPVTGMPDGSRTVYHFMRAFHLKKHISSQFGIALLSL